MSQTTIEAAAPATPKPMPRIRVSAGYLRLAATCMAVCDIRYYLQGVLIEPRPEGGAFLVATNGHHLIAIIDPDGECSAPTIISPSKATLAACPKANPHSRGKAECYTIKVEGLTALCVTDNDVGLPKHIQPRDTIIEGGKFPDWRRVLPDFATLKPGAPQCVNPIYRNAPLAAIGHGRFLSVEGFQREGDQLAPLVQRLCGMSNVVHVVMPFRGESDVAPWVDAWKGLRP
jgi:hypothetical protein